VQAMVKCCLFVDGKRKKKQRSCVEGFEMF
jgi:hypothetical protein